MAGVQDRDARPATEQTPLLRDAESLPASNGTTDAAARLSDAEGGQDGADELDLSFGRLLFMMGAGWVGVFLAAADTTIVATLLTPISDEFQSFKVLTWLATAYLIGSAALQPLSGKLTDIYGRKSGLLLANVLFFTGTLMCGLAQRDWVVIMGRVVAGLGGGCLNTITTFVASDIIPLRKRGVWQGIGNVLFGLGAGVGGLYGGWIHGLIGWRWAFLTQLPLIAISGTFVHFALKLPTKPNDDRPRLSRVDFLGSFALVAFVVLLQLGINSGGNIVPWNHPLVYISLPMAAFSLGAFIYIEDRVSKEPIIPIRIMLDRTVVSACLTNWFTTMAHYMLYYYGPIYFQARGYTAAQAGERLVPGALGTSIGSLGCGFIMRATGRYYILNVAVLTLYVTGGVLAFIFFQDKVADWIHFAIYLLVGTAYGGMLTITLISLISAVDHSMQAIVTSISYAFRATGSTIGLAVAGAIFQNVLGARLNAEFGQDNPAIIPKIRESFDFLHHLRPDLKERATRAFLSSLQSVWGAVLGTVVLGFVSCLFIRQHTLHDKISRK